MVELALVLPLLIMLVLGIVLGVIAFGSYWRTTLRPG